ncbi:IS66 family transposase [Thermochromatium tepidum]|uniref:IS66 family transposase n=1 Tax=Thermochromatium tepidum ATCC 43061 TaxID=316276 RepID=A0A6I6EKS1_THETI|nr:IS66 family transposase [Thermochromatium tepidum]QGU33687.1 IS66 family transposase [Thermochromatium tepidum ATCC 43061]
MERLPDLADLTHAEKDALIHLLWDWVTALRQEVVRLTAEVTRLQGEVAHLRGQMAKNSRNSSIPSSAEGLKKTKSMRKQGSRPPGGQPGHSGSTLKQVAQPDHVVDHPLPEVCDVCGESLTGQATTEIRQVFDLPPVTMEVTEHRIHALRCTCGKLHRSEFPPEVTAPVQYGPGVKAQAVYLTQHHMLPVARTANVLADLYGVPISTGTVQAMIGEASERLAPTVARIADAVAQADVAGADESGFRVAGKLNWLHTAVTDTLTWLGLHAKRGKAAFEDFGLLYRLKGTLVHDGWASYRELTCTHALCNAHHLRELTFVHEECGQAWAKRMIDLLVCAHHETAAAHGQPLTALRIQAIRTHYEAILAEAAAANPAKPASGRRGRTAQSVPFNLYRRLRDHADDVLRFTTDPRVPFSNNLAEQAIRMPKVKHKIAGCFRTTEGALAFCTIRSYLATLQKQHFDLFQSLIQVFKGNTPQPNFSG